MNENNRNFGGSMKYRNLDLTFSMDDVTFTVLSISNEQIIEPFPRHSHSRNSYELHYISYGYGTLIADDATYRITPGTFYMTGPQVFHGQVSDPDDPMREYGVYLKVSLPRKGTKSELLRGFLKQSFFFGPAAALGCFRGAVAGGLSFAGLMPPWGAALAGGVLRWEGVSLLAFLLARVYII